jgi:hypothetical protein
MTVLRLGAIALVLAQTSCGPPAIDGGFNSANPAAKMYAIQYAARDGDREAINNIIEQLSSDDPAVRLMAIGALQRLTGQTYGYCSYDPVWQRQAAIERWVQASKAGELTVHPASSSPAKLAPAADDQPVARQQHQSARGDGDGHG